MAAALLLAAGCADSTSPASPPAPTPLLDRIIFSSVHPDSYYVHNVGLWTMKTDGSDRRLLLNGLQWPESPTVSPDGEWVAFEDAWGLYVVDAGGAGLRQLPMPNAGRVTNPKWSPDGQWIAFDFQALPPNGQIRVYKIHPDGSGLTPVSALDGALAVWGPAWSPDGAKMAYIRDYPVAVGGAPDRRLIVKDLANGVETTVADSTTGFTGYQPAWSPDGLRLYYLDVQSNDWVIGQVALATGTRTILGSARGNRPASPDPSGAHLLFGTGDLWIADTAGGDPQQILADGRDNFEAFWTPTAPH